MGHSRVGKGDEHPPTLSLRYLNQQLQKAHPPPPHTPVLLQDILLTNDKSDSLRSTLAVRSLLLLLLRTAVVVVVIATSVVVTGVVMAASAEAPASLLTPFDLGLRSSLQIHNPILSHSTIQYSLTNKQCC